MNKAVSKLEQYLRDFLRKHGIAFEIQKQIVGTPDIFIEPNICIFIDRDYSHSIPEKVRGDSQVNLELLSQGYIVLRFRESEVETNPELCISKIKEQILLSATLPHPFLAVGPDSKEFALIARNLRRSKGITQKEIAEMVGVSQTAIACFEQGKRMLGLATVKAIANILGYEGEPFEFYDARSGQKISSRILARITAKRNRNGLESTFLITDSDVVLEILGRAKKGGSS